MISWMQKHKKWLVVTIWISTIAFVGAGMVGWGQFSFGSGDKVAKVGNIDISNASYNRKYTQVYNELAQLLNGNIDQEIAKKEGVDKIALNQLIQQALIENLALDFGIRVSDDEVAEIIANDPTFIVNDKFDKEVYKRVLADNNLRPSEFEEEIRKSLMNEKLLSLIPFNNITDLEAKAIGGAINISDNIEYKIIDKNNIEVSLAPKEIQEYYEKNKLKWSEPLSYKIQYVVTKAEDITPTQEQIKEYYQANKSKYIGLDGNALELENIQDRVLKDTQIDLSSLQAKRDYVKLRDLKDTSLANLYTASIKEDDTSIIGQSDIETKMTILSAISSAKDNDTLQPIKIDKGYVSIKLLSKSEKTPKSFESARNEVIQELRDTKLNDTLKNMANAQLKGFNGNRINNLTRVYQNAIPNLTEEEKQAVLSNIFSNANQDGIVLLQNKAFLYRIMEQNLLEVTQENMQGIYPVIESLKNGAVGSALLNYLNKRYKTSIFIDI